MPWQQKAFQWIGRPVGVSLRNGQGVSGVLCSVQNGEIFLLEYLYQSQFATRHYRYGQIQDVNPFPPCQGGQPFPFPLPFPIPMPYGQGGSGPGGGGYMPGFQPGMGGGGQPGVGSPTPSSGPLY